MGIVGIVPGICCCICCCICGTPGRIKGAFVGGANCMRGEADGITMHGRPAIDAGSWFQPPGTIVPVRGGGTLSGVGSPNFVRVDVCNHVTPFVRTGITPDETAISSNVITVSITSTSFCLSTDGPGASLRAGAASPEALQYSSRRQ